MKISGIVFDKDGTLMDIQPFWAGVIKYTAKEVLQQLVPPDLQSGLFRELLLSAGIESNGDIIPEGLVVAGTNGDIASVWEQILKQRRICAPKSFIADTRAMLGANYLHGEVRGLEHLPELLKSMKRQGLKLAVATSDDLEQTEYCLKKLNILDLVSPVMTANQVKRSKPDGEMLQRISQAWAIPPKKILVVGDSANDMLFAKNSGSAGLYLSPSASSLPVGAIGMISSLAELPRVLTELS